ncbi:MAG: hypothetical protein HY665_01910 [Chloroflexi bacterium]|nr:hypothetical protein [Chloroflexota bacterium]
MLGLKGLNKSQKGFTLLDVLTATAITGFIGAGISTVIFQLLNVNAINTNHLTAIKQVENANYWLGRDAQMAQVVQPNGASGFPLSLSWVEWDGKEHQVSYTLENGGLFRSQSIDGNEPGRTMVAAYINPNSALTNSQYANGVFTIKITSSVGSYKPASETRISRVTPRSVP